MNFRLSFIHHLIIIFPIDWKKKMIALTRVGCREVGSCTISIICIKHNKPYFIINSQVDDNDLF